MWCAQAPPIRRASDCARARSPSPFFVLLSASSYLTHDSSIIHAIILYISHIPRYPHIHPGFCRDFQARTLLVRARACLFFFLSAQVLVMVVLLPGPPPLRSFFSFLRV
jgi:hypothetical protein